MGTSVSKHFDTVTKLVKVNSPILTTVVGASGVVAVAVLAARAGAKSRLEIDSAWGGGQPTAKQQVQETWRNFIPTAVVASVTVGAIVTGHRINASRTAAATAAFALSERAFDEYRTRIVEKLGASEERTIRNEVREQEAKREAHTPVLIMNSQKVTVLDTYSGRYFPSDMQTIRSAVNDVNSVIWQQMYCSLSEFYEALELPPTASSDHVGWNNDHPLDIAYGTCLAPDDTPCLMITFTLNPKPNYADFGG